MVMSQRMILVKTLLFFLALSSAFAWSQKKAVKKNSTEPSIWVKSSTLPSRVANLETQESKPKPRYAGHPPAAGRSTSWKRTMDTLGGPEGEFVDEEGREEHSGQGQERGYHNDDKKVNDETKKDFKQAGAYQDFSQGGAVFDKHHKDHIAENKANENVNEHDAGEKFGAEALKEHKNGKHKEKSKGHKKYGFKNVYHKEEYGDHKTFHDEFLDNDHFHDYDDQHEHKQMQGGRFSKGYKRSGENKEHDVGTKSTLGERLDMMGMRMDITRKEVTC
ncbi:hypothetical protein CEXT_563801 [Caerostris extrusa]|uniref:Uncharacterized protein n=1 Tax=Caerostris extrusa TaxID=172846 RepID=A0AAV4SVU5_CAEEX|nr:hypothetical protein CEXT_563801 [Caerostris extrusa]